MRVVFVQKFVPHYRLPFFEEVRDLLKQKGIEFVLIYGSPDPFEGSKVKMAYPSWGIPLPTKHYYVKGRYLYWKNVIRHIKRNDYVVVEHAAKLLDNYLLFALRQIGWIKLGYFGHGKNFQSSTEFRLAKILKGFTLRNIDRWFAYTEVSRSALLEQNVARSKITVINNTLAKSSNAHLGNKYPSRPNCVFVGGIYELKLVPLLLNSAKLITKKIPDFTLHIVGDGPDKKLVDEFAKSHEWIKVHGSLYGIQRDKVIADAKAILMPGLVGLIAIDSFQFRRPIITTNIGEHSPEIAYLVHNENCLIDENPVTAESYARLVCNFLTDENKQDRLVKGCSLSSYKYSIKEMARNFAEGIV